jgi:ABC-type nitrate/sulfonate/bicarbonate transport system substrate-binding protein
MSKRSPLRVARLAVALAVVALLVPTGARAQTLPTLRIAAVPADGFAEAYYALDMGFFKKAGLDVDVQTFANGTAATIALASGAADVGITSPVNLVPAIERGVPFTLIAGGGLYTTNAPVVVMDVAKDSSFKTASDLEGKTIGVSGLNDIMQVSTVAWLASHGADPAKVRFVEVPFPQMGAALARGTVDAAVISEPSLTIARNNGLTRDFAKVYDAMSTEVMNGAWFTTMPFAQKNPELIKRFQAAIYETAKWANKNHDRSAQILEKYSKIDAHTAQTMTRSTYADSLPASSVQPSLDAAFKNHMIQKPFDANDMIYRSRP